VTPDPLREQQFELLAVPHSQALLRAATRLTGDRTLAEDIVQETLLLAWRSFQQFDVQTNCKAWLFRIMLNLLNKRHRQIRSKPQPVALDEEAAIPSTSVAAQPVLRSQILTALDSLTEEHRTVLLLGVVEGFTCKEIAVMLEIPVGTVMSRLSRARAALRNLLTGNSERPTWNIAGKPPLSRGIQ
jgi:RNA polymerase sigma-70 factor (ECF subfamily)